MEWILYIVVFKSFNLDDFMCSAFMAFSEAKKVLLARASAGAIDFFKH